MSDTIHMAYVCDDPARYIPQLSASIASVRKFNKDVDFTILSRKKFRFPKARVVTFDPGSVRFPVNNRLREGCYYKFWLTTLPYSKIIYIDCDVICQRPLQPIWDLPCENLLMTESHSYGREQAKALGIPRYALSGFMVMNLDNLRKMGFTSRCVSRLRDPLAIRYQDESVINLEFQKEITFIDHKYHYCHARKYLDPIWESDAYLLHFPGPQKGAMLSHGRFLSVQSLKPYLTDRRVAVIGNSESILGSGFGPEIDGYDCVIRFNRGFPDLHPEDVGRKTTALFLATTLSPRELARYRARFVIRRPLPDSRNRCAFSLSLADSRFFWTEPSAECVRLHGKSSKSGPSTGYLAVMFALSCFPKSVDLYGFDFFKSDSWHHVDGHPYNNPHNGDKEAEHMLELEHYGIVNIHRKDLEGL